MGKLDEAIAGQSGFPRAMPGLDQSLTVPQKIACAARILDAEGVVVHNHPYYGSLLSTMHKLPEITDQQACMFDGDIALFGAYTGGVDDAAGGQQLAEGAVRRLLREAPEVLN